MALNLDHNDDADHGDFKGQGQIKRLAIPGHGDSPSPYKQDSEWERKAESLDGVQDQSRAGLYCRGNLAVLGGMKNAIIVAGSYRLHRGFSFNGFRSLAGL